MDLCYFSTAFITIYDGPFIKFRIISTLRKKCIALYRKKTEKVENWKYLQIIKNESKYFKKGIMFRKLRSTVTSCELIL